MCRIVLAAALLSVPCAAPAQELRIVAGDCRTGVHLLARDVPVSRVLGELSKQLGFKLEFQADEDRPVNVDITRRAPQLVAKLLESHNVIYDEVPDPQCPGQQALAKVWVLPRGEDAPPRPRELTPMEQYKKAHGLPLDEPLPGEARPEKDAGKKARD